MIRDLLKNNKTNNERRQTSEFIGIMSGISSFSIYEINIPAIPHYIKYVFENKNDNIYINNDICVPSHLTGVFKALIHENRRLNEIIKDKNKKQEELACEIGKVKSDIQTRKLQEEYKINEQKKMEELEKEKFWYEYKQLKQNYNPLYR